MSKITVSDLSMDFKKKKALDSISLTFESGKIYGLLGRNGAGKTTLLNIINNRIFPTQGMVMIDNEPVRENDNALGNLFFMTEKDFYNKDIKVKHIIKWTAIFYKSFNSDYANELISLFDIDVKMRYGKLSTGYRSILKLILALASDCRVVMYDEPVLGLDANHREMFYRELIQDYMRKPKTIIVSTHLIEEISGIIEEVVIIKNGKLKLSDSVENLMSRSYVVAGAAEQVDDFTRSKPVVHKEKLGNFTSCTIFEPLSSDAENLAKSIGLEIRKAEIQKLFISLTDDLERSARK